MLGAVQRGVDVFTERVDVLVEGAREVALCRGRALHSVASTVTAHGGSLDIASEPDRGTEVVVRLPRVRPAA